jgi:hypothetical protein
MASEAESNGRDSEGPIPVKRVLSKCDTAAVTLPTFESPAKAHAAFAVDMVETQKALGWSYTNESTGLEEWRMHAEKSVQAALGLVDGSTPAQQLAISTAFAGYSARLRRAASPSAAWLQPQPELSVPPEELASGAPRAKVDRSVIEHLIDLRFVTNQLAVTVRKAKSAHDETLVKAAALKVGAITALSVSGSLFACFLLLMLVFVFIKIEVDLRDIRNAIKEDPLVGAKEMQRTLPSFVDARPQKGISYTDSELEAMRSAAGRSGRA